jgi:hypothetical protein
VSRSFFNQFGSSLVELLGATAAGLVVFGAALQSFSYFHQQFLKHRDDVLQAQDVRLSLELLAQELHLASIGSLSVAGTDAIEFTANISGLMTKVTAPGLVGETTLAVEDGRGWPDNKPVGVCWNERCDSFTLAQAGHRNLLAFVQPIARPIPVGASAAVKNRVRYYSRLDERGILRFLRQVDGGSSVLVGPVESVMFSYWDAQGRKTGHPGLVRRVIVEITVPHHASTAKREITLRT